ncbi:MAG: response regulator [Chloroflexi bacterium]|nr:response regulator [Chloroflexota bacterium]
MARKSIFIIDDHPVNLELAKVLLVLEGYEVHTAGDAEAALLVLPELRPDLILMDVQLPGMDGLELARRLKADPLHKNARIVALTAYAMKGDEEKALSAGCDGYLSKPIDTRTFPKTVASFLNDDAENQDKR